MTSIFSAVPYFSELSAPELESIEKSAVCRVFYAQQVIVLEGDTAQGLYIVESGWLKVVKHSTSGREQILNFLGPGDVFNAVAVFTGSGNQATVIALEEVKIWIIDRSGLHNLIDTHPRLARGVIRDLADRLQHLVGLVEDLSLRSIEARLARALLDEVADSTITRHKWATQTEMASRLGTVPDVLNRVLRKQVEEGVIEVARHQIRILDLEKLKQKINID